MKLTTATTLIALVTLLATTAGAAIVTEPVTGLQAWVPDEWVQSTEDGHLSVSAQGGEARVVFRGQPAASLDVAHEAMPALLERYVSDAVTAQARQDVDLNGLSGWLTSGTGTSGNEAVHWSVGAFLRDDVVLFVVVVANQATWMPHQNDLSLVMRSVAVEANPVQPIAHEH